MGNFIKLLRDKCSEYQHLWDAAAINCSNCLYLGPKIIAFVTDDAMK